MIKQYPYTYEPGEEEGYQHSGYKEYWELNRIILKSKIFQKI